MCAIVFLFMTINIAFSFKLTKFNVFNFELSWAASINLF